MKSRWLVEMFQCYETHHKRCMLLQFLPGPSLVQLVKSKAPSPHSVKHYAAEMLLAMNAVHSHGYIHRDIKLANFMLDHYGHVKLCDFGSCIRFLPADIAKKVRVIQNSGTHTHTRTHTPSTTKKQQKKKKEARATHFVEYMKRTFLFVTFDFDLKSVTFDTKLIS